MVRLEDRKHYTQDKSIEILPPPARIYLPLSQHLGKVCVPEVSLGESVLVGQRIASSQAHVSAPIHSSVSGKVCAIQDWPHPVLGKCQAIVIESSPEDANTEDRTPRTEEINRLSSEQIRKVVLEAGIVGMGGASFPAHIKLNPPKPVNILIINAAECEPYLTGDYRLMLERTQEILLGIELVRRCLGAKEVIIAIEENKPQAIEKFRSQASGVRCQSLRSRYPQGGEKQLIKNILGKEVPSGKLPFEVGVVVHNVGTVYAIYESVYLGKALYERVVTVAGSCLSNPKNLLVRLGTPIKELIDCCGPLKEPVAKIVIGGPMMGIAQYTDLVPVIKSTTGIILFNAKETRLREEGPCIRCGACLRHCPVNLMPCLLNLAAQNKRWPEAKAYKAMDCIECGSCNYVCPANRNLTQSIRRAKLEVLK